MAKKRTTQKRVTKVQEDRFRISKVSFRANAQLKPFHMVHVEAEVIVPRGAKASEAIEVAQDFVAKQIRTARDGKVEVVPQRVSRGKFLDRL